MDYKKALNGVGLSALAGSSTAIGGLIGILKSPDDNLLSFLLGAAIGVMSFLAVVEMLIHNAMHANPQVVIATFLTGYIGFILFEKALPDFDALDQTNQQLKVEEKKGKQKQDEQNNLAPTKPKTSKEHEEHKTKARQLAKEARQKKLKRLGFVTCLTMTLHNLPEGFAVAFSSYSQVGLLTAVAIFVHNIPEGIIVSAPIYAATDSRWTAMMYAILSGLCEPLGAIIAVILYAPINKYFQHDVLDYILSGVGGVMLAASIHELLPSALKTGKYSYLFLGVVVGGLVMLWTIYLGV